MNKIKYPYSVLYVEDEKEIRDNFVFYLDMLFEEVQTAEDGEIAYEIYRQKRPHILIVDINLPKLNGIDLLKKIREDDHTVRAIMLTAQSETDILLKATSLKLTKYLIKPVNKQELDEAIALAIKELLDFNVFATKKIYLKDKYSWDYELQELKKDSNIINLTSKEKKLFSFLMSRVDKVFVYEDIIYEVWTNENDGTIDTLKTLIKNLRKKLPKDTIINIFGTGYKIEQ